MRTLTNAGGNCNVRRNKLSNVMDVTIQLMLLICMVSACLVQAGANETDAEKHLTSPPVHQWIANEASYYFETLVPDTLLPVFRGYVASSYSDQHSSVLEGTWAEDEEIEPPFPADLLPFKAHFCAGGDGDELLQGLFVVNPAFQFESAYQRAERIWPYAVNAYPQDKALSFYYLGHIAHLLTDMTVPAHVHNDVHGLPGNGDTYEPTIGSRYKEWFYGGGRTGFWDLPLTNFDSLIELFRITANYTEDYPSDDVDGEGNTCNPSDYPTDFHKPEQVSNDQPAGIDSNEVWVIGDDLMPYAIRRVAELYLLFYHTVEVTQQHGSPLTLSMAANVDPVRPGEEIVYAMTVTNRGVSDLANVRLEMVVPHYVKSFYNNDVGCEPAGWSSSPGERIYWDLGTVPAGKSRTVIAGMMVQDGSYAPADGTLIHGSATVSCGSGFGASVSSNVTVKTSPLLAVGISADRSPVEPSALLTYTVVFSNSASVAASDVVLRAPVPTGTTFKTASGGGTLSGNEVRWSLGAVNPSQTGQRQFTVQVDSGASDGDVIVGYAEIGQGANPAEGGARGQVVTPVQAQPPLTLSMTANVDPVRPGEEIVYAMTVTNRGATDLADVQMHLVVPHYIKSFYNNDLGCEPAGWSSSSGDQIYWDLGTVPAGKSRTVIAGMMVQDGSYAPADGTLIHSSSTASCGSDFGASVSSNVAVDASPLLAVGITADKNPVEPSALLTYTVVFSNSASVAASDVVVRAPVPTGTTFKTASGGGTLSGNEVRWSLGAVNPSQTGQRQFTAQVDSGASDGDVIVGYAEIGQGANPAQGGARGQVVTPVQAQPPLTLSMTANVDPARPGEEIVYAMTVTNRGVTDLANVRLEMVVPHYIKSFYNNDLGCEPAGWSSSSGDQIYWDLGTVPAGKSRTVIAGMMVQDGSYAPADGILIHGSATVRCGSGFGASASSNVAVDASPLLAVGITADKNPVEPSALLTYTVVFSNSASVAASDVVLRAPVPTGTTFKTASGGGTLSGNEVRWSLGAVNPSQTGQRQFTAQVDSGASDGDVIVGYAEIGQGANPAQGGARGQVVTPVQAQPPLTLSMTANVDPARPGEEIVYAMTVTNRGVTDLANVRLEMVVPHYIKSFYNNDVGCEPAGWSSSPGDRIYWDLGTVPAGKSRTVIAGMMVQDGSYAPADGTPIHGSTMVYCGSGFGASASSNVAVDASPLLAVGITADKNPVEPSALLTYTVVFSNSASVAASDVVVRAPVPTGTTFKTASGGGTLSGNEVRWSLGAVNPSQTGQRQFTVQVDSGASDGDVIVGYAEIGQGANPAQGGARGQVVTPVQAQPPLTLSMTANVDPARPGEEIVYAMTVTNRSVTDLANVRLEMVVPHYIKSFYNNDLGCEPAGWSSSPGDRIYWDLGTVSAGKSNRLVTIGVKLLSGSYAPLDGTLIHGSATVRCGTGFGASASRNVVVDASPEVPVGPTAAFTADRTSGAPPLAIQFTDQSTPGSSPITSRQWDFGDSGTSTAQNPSHTYAGVGTYTVKLTVVTSVGSDMETKTGFITVTAQPVGPTAAFTADRTSGAPPFAVQFTDQSTPGSSLITSRQWDFGDSATSTAQNPSHTYADVGTYTVKLTIVTAVGSDMETKTGFITVTAQPVGPTAAFTADRTSGAPPLVIQFTDQSTPGSSPITSRQWDFGDSATSTTQNPSHTYAGVGTYTVKLTVVTAVGSDMKTKTGFITVTAQPVGPTAAFTADRTSGASPLAVQFTDQSTPGSSPVISRQWDFGDGGTSTAQNPSHTYAGVGTYTVKLTVITAVGSDLETKTNFITVTAQPVGPTAAFTADRTSGASPLAVQFTDQSTPGSSPITDWQWHFGDGGTSAAQNPNHTYSSPGAYTVTLTINTAVGTDTETKTGCVEVTDAGGNGTSGGCFGGSLTKSSMGDPVGRSRGDILLMGAVGTMLFSIRRRGLTMNRKRQ